MYTCKAHTYTYNSATLKTWEWLRNEARLKIIKKLPVMHVYKQIVEYAKIHCMSFPQHRPITTSSHSCDVFCGEVDDGWYEVLPDENGSDGAPVRGRLTNQQADALHGHLHRLWRVCQGTNLNQLLLLD